MVSEEENFSPLTLKNKGYRTPQRGIRQTGTWDPLLQYLTPGQTSPGARDYKEIIRQWFPNHLGNRDWFHGRQIFPGTRWEGWGVLSAGNATNGKRQRKKLCSPACPLLTSCCAVQFLTGRRPVSVLGLGVGEPCCKQVKVTVHTCG